VEEAATSTPVSTAMYVHPYDAMAMSGGSGGSLTVPLMVTVSAVGGSYPMPPPAPLLPPQLASMPPSMLQFAPPSLRSRLTQQVHASTATTPLATPSVAGTPLGGSSAHHMQHTPLIYHGASPGSVLSASPSVMDAASVGGGVSPASSAAATPASAAMPAAAQVLPAYPVPSVHSSYSSRPPQPISRRTFPAPYLSPY